jgi:hypothetical protein
MFQSESTFYKSRCTSVRDSIFTLVPIFDTSHPAGSEVSKSRRFRNTAVAIGLIELPVSILGSPLYNNESLYELVM